jgi:GGDEF domain-containing protein
MPSVALMATASKGNGAGLVGVGLHHRLRRDDTYHCPSRRGPQLLVDRRRQRTSGCRLWHPVVRRAQVDDKNISIPLALVGVLLWIVACSIGPIYARPEARATVMAAIGTVYILLAFFELWRGRGGNAWRWPIMVLLLAHAAVIPIHIPLAGALTHPDPADVDLFTFSIFEGAFICISTAYLLGGLVKDRIASGYQRASLIDPLTGVTNRRGFFQKGERLLMRARLAREPMALIMFDLDKFKRINDRHGHPVGERSSYRVL